MRGGGWRDEAGSWKETVGSKEQAPESVDHAGQIRAGKRGVGPISIMMWWGARKQAARGI